MNFFKDKKGQGLSLTVIIVAALALIVLVILAIIFSGRMASFNEDISKEGTTELTALKITYGSCHPTQSAENNFLSGMQSEDSSVTDETRSTLKSEISRCRGEGTDSSNCISTGCDWE
ncbi:hypothetical protein HN385_06885 [archaeon]|jgi:hypothetical protein|nr:hypothetical protein [archaeon]MBT3450998.1 hypothetical protein [archaeon]MBT6868582.1 hypothetical protein [archaeon]MBT7193114.1 hypothetical protein [archaeon]MBT7380431.1 hypothetical protein [archaeon]